MTSFRVALLASIAAVAFGLTACSDTNTDDPDTGPTGDGLLDVDEPEPDATGPEPEMLAPEPDAPEPEPEPNPEPEPDPACDRDGDGALSMECGGDDCDDNDNLKTPGRAERCDEIDNNCNGQINENADCTIFAHTDEGLYRIDPFLKTARRVTDVTETPLLDIDTHPDGTLYGITRDALFRFEDGRNEWFIVGSFPELEDGTGLAIDSSGTAWVTAADKIFTVDLITAEARLIGPLGSGFYSSGDCVVNKEDTLFMTSKARDQPDTLVLVNRQTGRGTAVGSIGFSSVYALTAGFGQLYGLNSRGELISIDRDTGAGTLLHTFEDLRWFGAASSPGR